MVEFKNNKWSDPKFRHEKTDKFIYCYNGLILFLDKVKTKNLKATIKQYSQSDYDERVILLTSSVVNCQNTQKFKHIDTSILELEKESFDLVTDGVYYTYKYLYDIIEKNGLHITLPDSRHGKLAPVRVSRSNEIVGAIMLRRL